MELKIKVSGAVLLTDELRTFVEEKVKKLEKLLDASDTSALCEVGLESVSQSRTGDSFRAEVSVTFAGGMAYAEAKKDVLHAALDEAVSETRRELRRTRTKHRDLVRRGAARVKDFFNRFRGQ
jgi:ribosomal subunit interface protein